MFKRETSTMSHKTMFIKYGCGIRDVNPSWLKCIWNGGSPSFYLISVTPLDPVAGKKQDFFFLNFEGYFLFELAFRVGLLLLWHKLIYINTQ